MHGYLYAVDICCQGEEQGVNRGVNDRVNPLGFCGGSDELMISLLVWRVRKIYIYAST